MENKKTGFISIIGRPSSGKSTLVNQICDDKISIVSKHPQTTRFIIKGIYNDDDSQIIFLDTPGFHHFDSILNKSLSNLAVRNLDDGDLILYLVDITREIGKEESEIMEKLIPYKNKLILAYNKSDLSNKQDMALIINEMNEKLSPLSNILISAKTGRNVEQLLTSIKENLQIGPLYYPDDFVTDQTIPFRIEESVREKVFQLTSEEVPHSVYVKIKDLDVTDAKIRAHATIYVEKKSQKGLLIGKGGSMIKQIGTLAREDLKEIFERNVELFLKVDIDHKWKKNEKLLKKMFNI